MNATLGAGLGLKPQHFDEALHCAEAEMWFEVHPENYLMAGGPRLAWLDAVRSRHPVSLHGVSLSLAGAAAPDQQHLHRLKELIRRVEPALVSEHLAWSTLDGRYYPDLLPVPRTSDILSRVAANIQRTQEQLQRRIAIENPSHYLRMDNHDWSETDFLDELVRRTGCGLLVDVNNVYVSAHNIGYDARTYLDNLPSEAIMEIHLAGHSEDGDDGAATSLLIDSHDAPVIEPVWRLYRHLIERIGERPTLIERDDKIPAFAELLTERNKAQEILSAQGVLK
jgi:uncharacterized protein (UPF0276 family)